MPTPESRPTPAPGGPASGATVRVDHPSPEDLPAIRALFRAGCVEGHVRENDPGRDIDRLFAHYFNEDGSAGFWVAREDDRVVGMIGVQRRDENVAEVRRLRVHPDRRRRGIGSLLMEQAIRFCREKGYLKVILDTRVEREPAVRLFQKFGFQLSRTRESDGRLLHDFYFDLYRDPADA